MQLSWSPGEPVPSVSGMETLKRTADLASCPGPRRALKRIPVYLLASYWFGLVSVPVRFRPIPTQPPQPAAAEPVARSAHRSQLSLPPVDSTARLKLGVSVS